MARRVLFYLVAFCIVFDCFIIRDCYAMKEVVPSANGEHEISENYVDNVTDFSFSVGDDDMDVIDYISGLASSSSPDGKEDTQRHEENKVVNSGSSNSESKGMKVDGKGTQSGVNNTNTGLKADADRSSSKTLGAVHESSKSDHMRGSVGMQENDQKSVPNASGAEPPKMTETRHDKRETVNVFSPLVSVVTKTLTPPADNTPTAKLMDVLPNDLVFGSVNAPVTMIEYSSYTCVHCAHFATDVMPKIKKFYVDTGKVKLILRDYPLDYRALKSAMLGRCYSHDRYMQYHMSVFNSIQSWGSKADDLSVLENIAEVSGMSRNDFKACIGSDVIMNYIVQEKFLASKKLGVESTPALFINGQRYSGVNDYAFFSKKFDELIAENPNYSEIPTK